MKAALGGLRPAFPPPAPPAEAEARLRPPRPQVPGREDAAIAVAAALLTLLGVVMVLDASYFHAGERFGDPYLFSRRHAAAAVVGALGLGAALLVPLRVLRALVPAAVLLVAGLLALVLVPGIGIVGGGARRWLDLGWVRFQPSELAKVVVVLYLARTLAKKGERVRELGSGFLPPVVVVGGLALLVLAEPDFGTACLLGAVLFGMLFTAGARLLHLGALAVLAAAAAVVAVLAADYRWQRVAAFLDPWENADASGYQLVQSLLAFGSGGLAGVGLGAGRQKMHYLPGAHTDFVFSVVGEELGLAGTLGVLALFTLLVGAGLRVAWRHRDPFASQVALGLTLALALQALGNAAVATGLVPTKGLALPFLSYGGSSLVVTLLCVGILIRAAREPGGAGSGVVPLSTGLGRRFWRPGFGFPRRGAGSGGVRARTSVARAGDRALSQVVAQVVD